MTNIKKGTRKFLSNFFKVLKKPEMAILPGQLAYYFLLALLPTITLLSMGASFLNLSTDVFQNFLSNAFSDSLANMILSVDGNGLINKTSTSIIVIIGYIVACNGISSIIVTSNTIYGIKNKNYFNRFIKASVMIFIILFLMLLMLLVPMFGDLIVDMFSNSHVNPKTVNDIKLFIGVMKGPILWFILFLFIKLIYTMAPDKKINSHDINYGATFTTIAWVLITYGYSFYVNNIANYSILYGNLANLVILLLWFNFLAYSFTIGLALNYHKEEEEYLIDKDLF